ncbi:hypothetical protein AB0442_36245 [Kitasatospora sp. NPDC085895]|uniref:hypothetical protein n=1 Tax=Kitasatospora sp. NPDC085895 TaxID=3155057 RepID=UPI00344C2031
MSVIALVGASGGPGVTTTALAGLLTWPLQPGRRVLLAECDPDGGSVVAGYLEGRVPGPHSLANLQVADRLGRLEEGLWEQLINLSVPDAAADRLLLPGLKSPAQAAGMQQTWPRLATLFGAWHRSAGCDVLLDLGRSGAYGASGALAAAADVVAVVVRGTLRAAAAARPRIEALQEMAAARAGQGIGLVLIDEGPYAERDLVQYLGLPVLARLPYDEKAARILAHGGDGGKAFSRSPLLRQAAAMGAQLQQVAAARQAALQTPAGEVTARGSAR